MASVFPVSTVEHVASVRNAFPVEVLVSAMLVAAPTGDWLPYWSWTFTSTKAEHVPAVSVCGGVLKAMETGGPGLMVTGRVAEASVPEAAVKVVDPDTSDFQEKVTFACPAGTVTLP